MDPHVAMGISIHKDTDFPTGTGELQKGFPAPAPTPEGICAPSKLYPCNHGTV